ncbi:BMP family protein [Microbaculum marinisediminis]|uniref:BMP family protein n=1 Tax=Microbaculum marinisediminis TaxID=2931392 RepID=A0AAW5R5I3_9HYPH|nr:BMP family protein [Microbaculum sp. A6E488]MCT8973894.1 BMP family protein [Microbaculum sp. A6E488]
MNSTRRSFFAATAVVAMSIFSAPSVASEFKAAAVLPGSITDQAFNQVVYEGLMKAKADLGIEVAFSEKVKQADQAEAMSDYARRGYPVVIGAGGEFTAAATRVSRQFDDTLVVVINGSPTENVATINYNNPQFGYILGFIGGKMSKTGNGGLIAGQEIKAFVDIAEGFRKGWKDAGASGEVTITYTDDWDDVAKAKEATLNLINQGADVVLPYLDNGIVGVVQAAEEKDIWVTGVITDLGKSSPKANLASTVLDFASATATAIAMAKDGKLERADFRFNLGSPEGHMGTISEAVPADVRAEADALIEKMKAGTFQP